MEPKVCAFALGHLNHQLLHNRLSSCFRCWQPLGDYRYQKMSEVMNSEEAKIHRKTLMSGQWPKGCSSCKDYEAAGQPSTRDSSFVHLDRDMALQNYNHETGEIKKVLSIELRFSNECNLSCRHCNTVHSSKWETMVNQDPTLLSRLNREFEGKSGTPTDGYFEDILENIVPGLQEILFSGGETLMQKQHYKFLDAIPKEHARRMCLLYVTNGTVRTLPGWDLTEIWKRFRKVTVAVSTDGVGERYEYFRPGAKWKVVEENMAHWKANGFEVQSTITCSVFQLFYLIETIEYLYENQVGNYVISSLVQYPPVLNPRIIEPQTKLQIKAEWDTYLSKITDEKKLKAFIRAGQDIIDYMMGDDTNIYPLLNETVSKWKDFEKTARTMDQLFKTSIEKTFPKIAATFENSSPANTVRDNHGITME